MKNLVVVVMMVCSLAACKKDKPKEVVLNAQPTAQKLANGMPKLTITQTDGKQILMTNLNGKILLVCFNPDCDHCQREAKRISDSKNILEGYQVYFLTPEPIEQAAAFQKEYNLTEPNVHFTHADISSIIQGIGSINQVPTFFIYKDQQLVKRLEGEIAIADLQAAMR